MKEAMECGGGGGVCSLLGCDVWVSSLEATQWAPRDLRHGSRRERSPLLPLEARPDSPGAHKGPEPTSHVCPVPPQPQHPGPRAVTGHFHRKDSAPEQ